MVAFCAKQEDGSILDSEYGNLTVSNSILDGGGSGRPIFLDANGGPCNILSCTLVNFGGILGSTLFSGLTLKNCVARPAFVVDLDVRTGLVVENNAEDTANATYDSIGITLTGDPFVDSANDDYSIATTSELAGTGTNLRTLTTTAKDITGEDRIYWDIGAFAANTAASSYKTEFKVVP
jgi:hypothetical protein